MRMRPVFIVIRSVFMEDILLSSISLKTSFKNTIWIFACDHEQALAVALPGLNLLRRARRKSVEHIDCNVCAVNERR
jgi:hypothetical protein